MATVLEAAERRREGGSAGERVRTELLVNLSHELKSPIAVLRAAGETLLRRGMDGSKRISPVVETIVLQSERLSKLADNLLQLAVLGGEALSPRRERFSLSRLTRDCVRGLTPRLKEKDMTLRVRLEAGVNVAGDRDGLRQAIGNLIDNALQYGRPGGRVSVALRRRGRSARLTVQDTGIGIARSRLAGLFRRFSRARAASKLAPSGTGLGLAIAKRIVEAHDGHIRVASRAGRGSRFHLSLPLG